MLNAVRALSRHSLRAVRSLVTAAGFALLAACGGSEESTGLASYLGTYQARRWQSRDVPSTWTVGDSQWSRSFGTMSLNGDGTYRLFSPLRRTRSSGAVENLVEEDRGTYRVRGTTLELRAESGGATILGTLRNDSLQFSAAMGSFLFVR
jgi:hypothetical protein